MVSTQRSARLLPMRHSQQELLGCNKKKRKKTKNHTTREVYVKTQIILSLTSGRMKVVMLPWIMSMNYVEES